jgi:hypothetical protein
LAENELKENWGKNMIIDAVVGLFYLVLLPVQLAVFVWTGTSSGNKDRPLLEVYIDSWKTLGSVLHWFMAPFFEPRQGKDCQ